MSKTQQSNTYKKSLPSRVVFLGWGLLLMGLVVTIAGYLIEPRHAAFTNVTGFLFLTSIAVGALFLVALEYLSGAVWSVPMRRVNEFLASLLSIAALLAVPLFFHLGDVFRWTNDAIVSQDAVLKVKVPYLNVPFLIERFAAVFFIWILFYVLFTRNSRKQDVDKNQKRTKWNITLSAIFMPIFAFGLTILSIDWAMSLEPRWYSTIFGVYYFSGIALAAVALATYVVVKLNETGYLPQLRRDHYYSLGTLMFVFVNFWAYIAFSQFMLIWYANLPEETIWFIARWHHGWEFISILLIVVQFGIPYFVLLSQEAKMDPRRLKFMAIWILCAHALDLYWLVMPTYQVSPAFGWTEVGFILLLVGIVIVVFHRNMKKYNLVPIGDPKLQRGLDFHL